MKQVTVMDHFIEKSQINQVRQDCQHQKNYLFFFFFFRIEIGKKSEDDKEPVVSEIKIKVIGEQVGKIYLVGKIKK